jgi:hypothetical protein
MILVAQADGVMRLPGPRPIPPGAACRERGRRLRRARETRMTTRIAISRRRVRGRPDEVIDRASAAGARHSRAGHRAGGGTQGRRHRAALPGVRAAVAFTRTRRCNGATPRRSSGSGRSSPRSSRSGRSAWLFRDWSPEDAQRRAYPRSSARARADLPVIVHDREAHADVLRGLRETEGVRGVLHCFSAGRPKRRRRSGAAFISRSRARSLTRKDASPTS